MVEGCGMLGSARDSLEREGNLRVLFLSQLHIETKTRLQSPCCHNQTTQEKPSARCLQQKCVYFFSRTMSNQSYLSITSLRSVQDQQWLLHCCYRSAIYPSSTHKSLSAQLCIQLLRSSLSLAFWDVSKQWLIALMNVWSWQEQQHKHGQGTRRLVDFWTLRLPRQTMFLVLFERYA